MLNAETGDARTPLTGTITRAELKHEQVAQAQAEAKVAKLSPRAIGDRDTPLQDVDPYDKFESGFGLLPDGVASSRPPPKDKRQR